MAIASTAAAQQASNPGRTISGIVRDTASQTLDGAEVFIPSLRRTTAADTSGRFLFSDIKSGTYDVAVRRLGFFPQTRTVVVTNDSGGRVEFSLVPNRSSLPTVSVTAARGGLSGVIGDTSWRAIAGAEILVSGARRAVSDSSGA